MEENKNELENEVVNTPAETTPEPAVEPAPVEPAAPQPVAEATPEAAPTEPAPEVITLPKPEEPKPKKSKTGLIITIILLLLVVAGVVCYFVFGKGDNKENKDNKGGSTVTENNKKNSPYRLSGNGLEEFDLQFLKLVGTKANTIYSPISIKYALAMLNEGTKGDTHTQIEDLIGDYKPTKYTNSANLAFGNAFFIKDTYVNEINQDTVKLLQDKYNAEVKTGSFDDPGLVNNWISEKTLGLIKNLLEKEDIQNLDYMIVNALGIDMEWTSYFVPRDNPESIIKNYSTYVSYPNTDFGWTNADSVLPGKFNNSEKNYQLMEVNASYNNYDVVKAHGGEEKYKQDIADYLVDKCGYSKENAVSGAENVYKNVTSSYKQFDKSTDFYFYTDDDVKVFAKDLKEYDGVQLQYVGFEPQKVSLEDFVKDVNTTKLNLYLNKMKEVKPESFEEGYVTKIIGTIPKFKYSFDMDLKEKLIELGVKDVFDPAKADITKLTKSNSYIAMALHAANIEFTEYGIKAAAVTIGGGAGNIGSCTYTEKMKVKTIDMTFDKPYMYIIRNKKTGEVWFTGSVVEPTEYTEKLL